MTSMFSVRRSMPAALTIRRAQVRMIRSIHGDVERNVATISVADASGIVTTTTAKATQIVRSIIRLA